MNFHLVLFFYSELQLYNIKKAFAGSFKGSAELLNQTSFDGDCWYDNVIFWSMAVYIYAQKWPKNLSLALSHAQINTSVNIHLPS